MAIADHIKTDSPTDNHCVWNSLAGRNKDGTADHNFLQPDFSEGNTKVDGHADEVVHAIGTIASSGKHYAEFIVSGGSSAITGVGVISNEWDKSNLQSYINSFGGVVYTCNGAITPAPGGTIPAISDSVRVAIEVDFGGNTASFYTIASNNATRTAIGNTVTSSNGLNFNGSGTFASSLHNDADYVQAYFKQDEWWGGSQVSAGYTALSTSNLPASSIDVASDDLPEDYFKAVKYNVGTGTTVAVDVGFNGDLHWIKCTTDGERHYLVDTVRSTTTTFDDFLNSNNTEDEGGANDNVTNATITKVSNGFEVSTTDATTGELYFTNRTYISWNWKAGGSPSSSDPYMVDNVSKSAANAFSGSYTITPTRASINQKSGFSIVKFNSGSADNVTIPHGLNAKPDFVLLKALESSASWYTFHNGLSDDTKYLYLNSTSSESGLTQNTRIWGGRTFDSNVISAETGYTLNADENYIAYCWKAVSGYSLFSSYVGNGDNNDDDEEPGPFIYTGFSPAFVWIKSITNATRWYMYDNVRSTYNGNDNPLSANESTAESSVSAAGYKEIDLLSNGFKIRNDMDQINKSGESYLYCAWAEQPLKFANAR